MSKAKISDFINESKIEFKDVSHKRLIEFRFPNRLSVIIDGPLLLGKDKKLIIIFDHYGQVWRINVLESWFIKDVVLKQPTIFNG